ncbi:MAG: hypothetical protein GEV03_23595 [Streptosporangiales bacterium]|nr:hypothetical protein [Streptosporangiales bacterium]
MTVDRQAPPEARRPIDEAAGGSGGPAPDGGGRPRVPEILPNLRSVVIAFVVAVLVAGIALRSWAASPLWLDEAQTVAISSLPLDQLFQALREDGSPPLYYLLLHAWMLAFGHGDLAVRGFSAIWSVATLPLLWLLVRRLSGSRSVGWIAVVLFAASPFAVRYATEARMYSFIVLLTVLGGFALASLRRPGPLPVLGVALVAGALALSHYWTLFLLMILGAGMLWLALRRRVGKLGGKRGDELGRAATKGLLGLALGAVPFLPWLPSFIHQLIHTGAPWANAAWFTSVGGTVDSWSGGGLPGQFLGFLYWAFAAIGFAGRVEDGRLVLGRPTGRVQVALVVFAFGPITLGVAASHVMSSAYADRYSAIGLVSFLILIAYGIAVLPRGLQYPLVCLVAVFGLLAGVTEISRDRTQAGQVAEVINEQGQPGDVVVVCPDQLGPGVRRLLPGDRFRQVAYPTFADPARVDWTDYEARNEAADPAAFADRMRRFAGDHTVWYAYADGYRTLKHECSELRSELQEQFGNSRTFVRERTSVLESETLVRFNARR